MLFYPRQVQVFFPARKGKKWKNIFRTSYLIHINPPSTYLFFQFFFAKEGIKMEKNVFSSLDFYSPLPFIGVNHAEYKLLSCTENFLKKLLTKKLPTLHSRPLAWMTALTKWANGQSPMDSPSGPAFTYNSMVSRTGGHNYSCIALSFFGQTKIFNF